MRLKRFLFLFLSLVALAPMVAGASASYTWDIGLDGWGPWGSASDCTWDGAVGRASAGSMAAGVSCLSPAFSKAAGDNPSMSFWIASSFAGLAGRVAVVLDPLSTDFYCNAHLSSSSTDPGVWDEQIYVCGDLTVEAATQFHVLIDYSGGDLWVDDFGISNAALAPTATPTPVPPTATPDTGPILVTATPTPVPFITPATPTPIPTQPPINTVTPVPSPVIVLPSTPTPGAVGDLYFPLAGGNLLDRARDWLADWWVIIGPAGLAALTGIVLVKLADFMKR